MKRTYVVIVGILLAGFFSALFTAAPAQAGKKAISAQASKPTSTQNISTQTTSTEKMKNAPRYTADHKLIVPANYREWIYLSSGLGMNYGPATAGAGAPPAFTNVFVNPESYREFMKTGKWLDGTTFVLEVYGSATHSNPNKSGQFQDDLQAVEAEVKDNSTPEVWRYYGFGTTGKEAAALPKEACFSCHEKSAAVEHSFTQFYPALLEVALAKGVIKKGVHIPLNASRVNRIVDERGWKSAEAAIQEQQNAGLEGLSEPSLNAVGYRQLQNQKNAEAVSVFEFVAKEHPESANAFDSLADGYVAAGRTKDAITASEKALELLAKDERMPARQKKGIEQSAKQRLEKLKSQQADKPKTQGMNY
jgi:hypothetical protein